MNPKHPAGRPRKMSPVVKRPVNISGHFTSVGLEDAFIQLWRQSITTVGYTCNHVVGLSDENTC